MEHLGLVGAADSGHADLFSALTGLDVQGAQERVLGVVQMPDERVDRLAAMSKSKKVVAATFQVAFLPGFSTEPGKSLGSRLVGTLRDSDALMMVIRADEGRDPARERSRIEDDLVIADLDSVEQREASDVSFRVAEDDVELCEPACETQVCLTCVVVAPFELPKLVRAAIRRLSVQSLGRTANPAPART